MTDLHTLAGRTALVTGGARRLGLSTAQSLAREGVNVVVHYNRSREEAESVRDELSTHGVSAWCVGGDLSVEANARAVFDGAVEQAGPIDFLINSAAIFPEDTFHTMSPQSLNTSLAINAFAPLILSQAFAAQERAGSIVNLLDTRIQDFDPQHASYHVSKRTLFTLTRMAARSLAPAVRVNAVAPGLILPPPGRDQQYLEELAHTNPLNAVGNPGDVADAVIFLLKAKFVTGQVLYVDGGRHMLGRAYA